MLHWIHMATLVWLVLAIFPMDHTVCAARVKVKSHSPESFQIFLAHHPVEVTGDTTVAQLKTMFEEVTHYPVEDQKIILNGVQLENETATISQLEIERNTTLRLTSGLPGGLAHGAFRDRWKPSYDFVGRLIARFTSESGPQEGTCTALVQGYFALTAAHCFTREVGGHPELSKWELITTSGSRRLLDAKIHPHYNTKDDSYDFAFVKLDRPHQAQQVVLDASPPPPGEVVQMAGFGMNEDHKFGSFGVADFVTAECPPRSKWIGKPITCSHTGPTSPTSTCGGDSGGPWWRMLKDTQNRYRIFGVQSFGYDGECGEPSKKSGISLLTGAQDFLRKHVPQFVWNSQSQSSSSSSAMPPQSGPRAVGPPAQHLAAMPPQGDPRAPRVAAPTAQPHASMPPPVMVPPPPPPHVFKRNLWSASGM